MWGDCMTTDKIYSDEELAQALEEIRDALNIIPETSQGQALSRAIHLLRVLASEEKDENGLYPCPFCGEHVEIRESNDIPPYYGIDHFCGRDRRIDIKLRWKETPGLVKNSWNRRVEHAKLKYLEDELTGMANRDDGEQHLTFGDAVQVLRKYL